MSNDGETEDPARSEPGRDRHAYLKNRAVSDTLFGPFYRQPSS